MISNLNRRVKFLTDSNKKIKDIVRKANLAKVGAPALPVSRQPGGKCWTQGGGCKAA